MHWDYLAKDVTPTADDAYSFSMWSGYLKDQTEMLDWFNSAGSMVEHIHTSGHASPATLRGFAAAISAKSVIPVHGGNWETEQDGFGRIVRLRDAEAFAIWLSSAAQNRASPGRRFRPFCEQSSNVSYCVAASQNRPFMFAAGTREARGSA